MKRKKKVCIMIPGEEKSEQEGRSPASGSQSTAPTGSFSSHERHRCSPPLALSLMTSVGSYFASDYYAIIKNILV